MHVPVERFVGVLENHTILFLQPCEKCKILITYPEQGHHCIEGTTMTEVQKLEAEHYVHLMLMVKSLYVLPRFDAPRK
jgi:hypothetical protein